jgi:hypothetical protein
MRLSGATLKTSPYWSSRESISRSVAPPPSDAAAAAARTAVGACSERMEMDSTAFCRASALTKRPTMMSVTSRALVSKKSPVESGRPRARKPKETSEKTYAALVLRTMSRSISTMRAKTSAFSALV